MPRAFIIVWLLFVAVGVWAFVHFQDKFPPESKGDWLRGIGFFLAGVGVAPLGLWLASQRTETLMEQTKNEAKRRITDAFTKAVELLGNTDTAVKQGGIYALGRLALEDEGERPKILDILAAYVRQKGAEYHSDIRIREELAPAGAGAGADEEKQAGLISAKKSMHIDLEAAIAAIRDLRHESVVMRELSPEHGLDLSNTILVNADFSNTMLGRIEFGRIGLARAGAGFSRTELPHANLSDSQFHGCVFENSDLRGANMVNAKFPGSYFRGARLERADMRAATFDGADMQGTSFAEANVRGADFGGAKNLTAEQLSEAEGDGETKLPPGVARPKKWGGTGRG